MVKVITVKYEQKERRSLLSVDSMMAFIVGPELTKDISLCTNPESAFTSSVTLLAESYKRHRGKADFGIIDSADVSDICLSNQCFFDNQVLQALQGQGFNDVQVCGLMGGSYEYVLKRIQEDFPGEVEYLDEVEFAKAPVLYRFQRKG